jgi:hypothetical protein
VDVAVALDRGQILQHRRAEAGELLNEPALAPGDGVSQAGTGNVAEAVGNAVTGRAQPEEPVGFGDLSCFNRTFRQRYGITPSDARWGTVGCLPKPHPL